MCRPLQFKFCHYAWSVRILLDWLPHWSRVRKCTSQIPKMEARPPGNWSPVSWFVSLLRFAEANHTGNELYGCYRSCGSSNRLQSKVWQSVQQCFSLTVLFTEYFSLTVLFTDSSFHWQCFSLTVIFTDSSFSLTVLFTDSAFYWQFFSLTVLFTDSFHWQCFSLTVVFTVISVAASKWRRGGWSICGKLLTG